MMPSSLYVVSTSKPARSLRAFPTASAHGACTRAPKGLRIAIAPVSELVPEPLDDDVAIRWNRASLLFLLREIFQKEGSGFRLEPALLGEARERFPAGRFINLARESAERAAELERPSRTVSSPERRFSRLARSRRNDDPVAGDSLDSPGRGTEGEGFASPRFVDHLLVELADARSPLAEVDGVEPPIGDGARVQEGQHFGACPRGENVLGAIPREARPQVRQVRSRVVSREHLDDGHQDLTSQLPVWKSAARESFDFVDPPRPLRAESHHLLREHVQRTRRDLHALNLAFEHPLGDDGALEQIPLELGKEDSPAPLAHGVPRSADSLQAARDRSRRFHQNHEIDGPHIDPELEGARGDDALELAPLQRFLNLAALLVGKASMVSAEERSLGELVQPLCGFLGERAAVDEDECRPMRPEKTEDLGVDPGP